jgi:hypothetical protein
VAETEEEDEPVGEPYRLAARKRRLQLMTLNARS